MIASMPDNWLKELVMKQTQEAFLYFTPQTAFLKVVVDASIVVVRYWYLYCISRISSIVSGELGSTLR